MAKTLPPAPSRLDIASRCVAALIGGYCLSITLPVLLGLLLFVNRAQATQMALLLSFAVYTVAILWAFSARSHWHAWVGLLFPAIVCGTLGFLMLSLHRGPLA